MARSGLVGHVSARTSKPASPSPSAETNIRWIGFMIASLQRVGAGVNGVKLMRPPAVTERDVSVQYFIPLAIYSDLA